CSGDCGRRAPGGVAGVRRGGTGPGVQNRRKPEAWRAAVEAEGHGRETDTPAGRRERAEEALMMGLRLSEGVWAEHLRAASGLSLDEVVPPARSVPLEQAGLLTRTSDRLIATKDGRAVLDGLLARLLA